MTAQHTPGPWAAVPVYQGSIDPLCDRPYQIQCEGVVIANVSSFVHEMQANARLIAAAPELLAALEATIDLVPADWLPRARAAIAAATEE